MNRTVWIDLDNSPHVPLFAPVIAALIERGIEVAITARSCFQVCDLADLLGLSYQPIGRHFGKHPLLKVLGLGARSLQLLPYAIRNRPNLALSHGSRAQLAVASLLRIPSVLMMDYEFARGLLFFRPDWLLVPELIARRGTLPISADSVLTYPGIKEDVYAPEFKPVPSFRKTLGLGAEEIVVVLRPPAQEAHYHVAESDRLFAEVMRYLAGKPARVVTLPRNSTQGAALKETWPELFASGKFVIPDRAVDGMNLIWNSDLVISGGGTMNREAAALGVPVFSIFRGSIGAVDRYLADSGRLTLVSSVEDVPGIPICPRSRPIQFQAHGRATLTRIVEQVSQLVETSCTLPQLSVP